MKAELKTGILLAALFGFMAPASPAQDVKQRIRQLDAQARTEERVGNAEAARIVLPENPQEALRLASRSLELRPGTYGALEICGRAFLALGETSSGIVDFKQVAMLNPQDAANHFQLARADTKAGMKQVAQAGTTIYERIQSEAHFPTKVEAPAVSPASPATP
jgi:tetratricopeptide (TPR) repeat protein